MIKADIYFSIDQAVQLFRNAGFIVFKKNIKKTIQIPHRVDEDTDIPTWMVINPLNSKEEDLVECFKKYIKIQSEALFLEVSKKSVEKIFKR